MNESAFVQDLAMLMAMAGIVAALFSRFRFPKVLGYIFAGILMSEYTWGGGFLANVGSVRVIAQLGVVFLMLSMGLDFSPTKIHEVRTTAFPVAIIDTLVMLWLGYTVGTRVFDWGYVPSLFLGAAICDSATTMLGKTIDELKWGAKPFVPRTIGTSVCEDMVCVGIIALITGVANGSGMSFAAVGASLGGLFVFFLATIVFGLILVPRLLTSVAKRNDDEALLLTLLGCCFFVTYVAFKLHYSVALGAFLVGILGASSEVRKRLHDLADPLRSLFAAIFFVSIGLLVDPATCLDNIVPILVLSGVVIVGKGLNCFIGGLVTGESIKTSVQMGFGLAQIGEFAYMVALLYVTLTKDIDSPMYQIVVGVSLLTTILNPVLLRVSDPIGDWADAHCPRRLKKRLEAYRGSVRKYRETAKNVPKDRQAVRRAIVELAIIAALEFAFVKGIGMLSNLDYSSFSSFFERHDTFFFCVIANAFMAVVVVLIYRITHVLSRSIGNILVGIGHAHWQVSVRRIVRLVVFVLVALAFYLEWVMLNVDLLPDEVWAKRTILGIFLVVSIFGWRFCLKAGQRAVSRFEEALTADERFAKMPKNLIITVPEGTLRKVTVPADSPAIGETVVTLDVRARTGASVVSVFRDGKETRNVGPDWRFAAGDVVVALGNGDQIDAFTNLLEGDE